jgi:hypothetical protein
MNALKYAACIAMLYAFISSCSNDKYELPEPQADECGTDSITVSWNNGIRSIIETKCSVAGCHVPDSAGGNGFDFTTYAAVKQKVDNGALHQRVFVLQDMPPAGSPTLSTCDKKKLQTWINNSAPE